MTITHRVKGAFFSDDSEMEDARLIRLAPNAPPSKGPTRRQGRPWTHEEHDRFLHAMEMYPSGPWKEIAAHVGTRTTRQTMTHAQKYRQKIERWKRGASTAQPSFPKHPSASVAEPKATGLPPSPQAPHEVAPTVQEDFLFWRIVHDILEVHEEEMFDGSMVALLTECQRV